MRTRGDKRIQELYFILGVLKSKSEGRTEVIKGEWEGEMMRKVGISSVGEEKQGTIIQYKEKKQRKEKTDHTFKGVISKERD